MSEIVKHKRFFSLLSRQSVFMLVLSLSTALMAANTRQANSDDLGGHKGLPIGVCTGENGES